MTKMPTAKIRCAIYTRKSSEEGLDMEFNSLDAQREACEAYVTSQKREGWLFVPDHYDDGGFSGGTLERPALKRLLADIEAGRIDCVVVYKIDRLSRALVDFTKLVEVFDRHNVTFVSITQSFNTTTSMGRLTLNILLSFAQFEREVIGERIRDKFAASRKKGMWMGGMPPLGYDVHERKLVVNEKEATLIRHIFERFIKVGSATALVKELNAEGRRTKSWTTQNGRLREGRPFNKGTIYKLLGNRIYIGEAVHKGKSYPGEHQAIIPMLLWDKVRAVLAENTRTRANRSRAQTPALLKGIIFGANGKAMTPSHTRKNGILYRYYVNMDAIKMGRDAPGLRHIAAGEIEEAVIAHVRAILRSPEIVARTWRAANGDTAKVTEQEIIDALQQLDPLWDQLFPTEQARIVRLLVKRVEASEDGIEIHLRCDGLESLAEELRRRSDDDGREAA
jgi:site-specific DNA recombinase